jgi:hypothetical protein
MGKGNMDTRRERRKRRISRRHTTRRLMLKSKRQALQETQETR